MKNILLFTFLLINTFLFAQNKDGSLDSTFGTNGIVISDFSNFHQEANDGAIQKDGKIVVGGDIRYSGSSEDFLIVRYNSDGTLDNTFGNNGLVLTKIAEIIPDQWNKYVFDKALDVLIQPDGKILICGFSIVNISGEKNDEDFLAVRYNSDGSLDTFFGYGGVAVIDVDIEDIAASIALQSDGKIILVGQSDNTNAEIGQRISAIRLNRNGTLDNTFANNGKIFSDKGYSATDVKIQPDDKIVIGAYSNDLNPNYEDFLLIRLKADGTLDQTFNNQSYVITSLESPGNNSEDRLECLAIQSDGKIVAAGIFNEGFLNDVALVRYNSDGTLDNSFGTNGKALRVIPDSINSPFASDVLIQPDGKIVIGGRTSSNFFLARYNSNGSLDNSFGVRGINETIFEAGKFSAAYSIAMQKDGKIILAGYSEPLSGSLKKGINRFNSDFAVARYNSGLNFEEVTFTNGGNFPLSYNQTSYGSIPAINWAIGQFSITSNSGNEILNDITIKLTGNFSGLEGKPFRLYSADENNFTLADSIGTNIDAVTPDQEITFTNLNEQIISGTKYFWVTVDLTENYWGQGKIHAVVENENKINLIGGNLSQESQYGILDAMVQLVTPNLNEILIPGETYFITWNKKPEVTNVDLYYSANAGKDWNLIVDNLHPSFTNYSWTIPSVNSDSCLIKISSTSDSSIYDISDTLFSIKTSTSVNEKSNLPKEFSLEQNYPNPFNPNTKISYQLPENSLVEIKVFDILGREISTLVNEFQNAGSYKINFDASDLESGIYLYKIKTEKFVQTRKMILVK